MVANAIARADSPRGSPVGRAGSLIDTLGRRIHHLRLSVTSACDLHCVYCRPRASGAAGRGLTDAKRLELVQFMHRQYGLTHVRITGGEPLLHVGVVGLIQSLRTKVPELSLAMTTNGQRLTEYASSLRSAGLDRLNVSLDSLDPHRYRALTGGSLTPVLDGLDAALDAGFPPPKVNVVVLRGQNDQELVHLVHWAFERDIELRFLEAMPIGPAAEFNRMHFVSADEIESRLSEEFKLTPLPKEHGATANCYVAEGAGRRGVVGLIAPMTRPFCGGCGRVRLTADGLLYPCLLDDRSVDLQAAWVYGCLHESRADQLIQGAIRGKLPVGPRRQSAKMVVLGG